jgi:hypothetical protein
MSSVPDKGAMIAGMRPRLVEGTYVFATLEAGDRLAGSAIATMQEQEGLSVNLQVSPAGKAALSTTGAFRQITLDVRSALDGIGLTAAVSAVPEKAGIPCNMVAGHHHDHVFVPAAQADDALACLQDLSAGPA